MAVNRSAFRYSLTGAPGPLLKLIKAQAGSTQAIKQGELCEISSGNAVPLSTDKTMSGTVVIAHEEIKSGDRAGYYHFIIPRPGDVFEFDLASGADDQSPDYGDTVYVSGSQEVTTTNGTNVLGVVYDHDGFPTKQGHAADDASVDAGTTIGSAGGKVLITIKEGASYWNVLQPDDA